MTGSLIAVYATARQARRSVSGWISPGQDAFAQFEPGWRVDGDAREPGQDPPLQHGELAGGP